MSQREEILNKLKENRSKTPVELIEFDHEIDGSDLIDKFYKSLETANASHLEFSDFEEAKKIILSEYPEFKTCVNTVDDLDIKGLDISEGTDPKSLHPLDISIINGEFGVAENGAIWVNTGELPLRIIPFICESLVLILNKKDVVGDMHEAYSRTNDLDYSFGMFIAGPSKTADIEQTLVVGAQGPRKMLVLIQK